MAHFKTQPMKVFYERQLQVLFEKRGRAGPYGTQDFFHWITARALEELFAEGTIKSVTVLLNRPVTTAAVAGTELPRAGGPKIRFFWPRGARYVTREAEANSCSNFLTPNLGVHWGTKQKRCLMQRFRARAS